MTIDLTALTCALCLAAAAGFALGGLIFGPSDAHLVAAVALVVDVLLCAGAIRRLIDAATGVKP